MFLPVIAKIYKYLTVKATDMATLKPDNAFSLRLNETEWRFLSDHSVTESEQIKPLIMKLLAEPKTTVALTTEPITSCVWIDESNCPISDKVESNTEILKNCKICPRYVQFIKEIKETSIEPYNREVGERIQKMKHHYSPEKYPSGKCEFKCDDKEHLLYPFKTRDGIPMMVCSICKSRAETLRA